MPGADEYLTGVWYWHQLFRLAVPVQPVDATPSGINLLSKVVFMTQGKRFGLSAVQKSDMWRRWKAGQSLHEIGRAFGKSHSSIRCLVSHHGGFVRRSGGARSSRSRCVSARRSLGGWLPARRYVRLPNPGPNGVDREPGSRTSWWPFCVSSQRSRRRGLGVGLAPQAVPSCHPCEVAEAGYE